MAAWPREGGERHGRARSRHRPRHARDPRVHRALLRRPVRGRPRRPRGGLPPARTPRRCGARRSRRARSRGVPRGGRSETVASFARRAARDAPRARRAPWRDRARARADRDARLRLRRLARPRAARGSLVDRAQALHTRGRLRAREARGGRHAVRDDPGDRRGCDAGSEEGARARRDRAAREGPRQGSGDDVRRDRGGEHRQLGGRWRARERPAETIRLDTLIGFRAAAH
jgi:hypothetical protein